MSRADRRDIRQDLKFPIPMRGNEVDRAVAMMVPPQVPDPHEG